MKKNYPPTKEHMEDWLRRHWAGLGFKWAPDGCMVGRVNGRVVRYTFRKNRIHKETYAVNGKCGGWYLVAEYYTLSHYRVLQLLSRSWV